MGLTTLEKSCTSDLVFQKRFRELRSDFKDFIFYFTDGSKMNSLVGSAFISSPNTSQGFKLNAMSSVFTAELFALSKALEHIGHRPEKSFVICSDSLSSLQAINTLFSPLPLVQAIHSLLTSLASQDVRVVFCWVPGHVGIQGNELADKAARAATENDSVDFDRAMHTDLKAHFKCHFKKKFQELWDAELNNKLKEIKPTIENWDSSIRSTRREEVVLTRLRIGHTLFSHAFLFSLDKIPPRCHTCNEALTVKHVLLECSKYRGVRRRLSLETSISKVLGDDPKQIDKLFKFLREIDVLKVI
jgi:ribonuclease HI